MDEPVFFSRAASGLGPVVNNDGWTRRPLLDFPLDYLTGHYTGVSREVRGQVRYPPDMDTAHYLRVLQRWAQGAGKSFEYSVVIPPTVGRPEVWEYAGDYRAAHTAGWNSRAYGVLFVNGIGQPLTDAQVVAWRWWRDVLKAVGKLNDRVQQVPHREMPGASTTCWGDEIDGVRWRLLAPYVPIPPPSVPEPLPSDDMAAVPVIDHMPNTPSWAQIVLEGSLRWNRGQSASVVARINGGVPGTVVSDGELVDLIQSFGTTGPSPWDADEPGSVPNAMLDAVWKAARR